jgi:CheY-like chemotaxis protein
MSERTFTREEFVEWVRSALQHIYDSQALASLPLADLLTDEGSHLLDRAQNLRHLLLQMIDKMRPGPEAPIDSPDWRAYRILEMRYIEGVGTAEAMNRLSIQKSQFFRDQARAQELLAESLWELYEERGGSFSRKGPATDEWVSQGENSVYSETERLLRRANWEEVDVNELLREIMSVVRPLVRAEEASIQIMTPAAVRITRGSRVSLRQAILNVITYGLEVYRGRRIELVTFREPQRAGLHVQVRNPDSRERSVESALGQDNRLDVCRQLIEAMGGSLEVDIRNPRCHVMTLAWTIAEPPTLLVIDDNQGFLDLFRRYLTGHNWQMIEAADGAAARAIIARERPTVIILDVLMPQEDGWDLLTSFKRDEDTRDIPVIVCSVLKESQLAFSLGADAYLPKPVTEGSLLKALAPWGRS